MRESLQVLHERRLKLERDCAEIREKIGSKNSEIRSSLDSLKQKVEQQVVFLHKNFNFSFYGQIKFLGFFGLRYLEKYRPNS